MDVDLSELIKTYDVRGVTPDPLSPEVARAIGTAFAQVVVWPDFLGHDDDGDGGRVDDSAGDRPKVVIGQDMRESGVELVAAFTEGLTSAGVDVELIGLCSTDGLYYAAASRGIPGAMFTASHNPAQYNGIKMCRSEARPVGETTGLAAIRDLAGKLLAADTPVLLTKPAPFETSDPEPVTNQSERSQLRPIQPDKGTFDYAQSPGRVTTSDDLPNYARFLRSLVNLSEIRPLKVVIDAGNGMAGLTAPAVLGTAAGLPELPLEIIPLYFELDGNFPNHEANPLDPANLVDLQAAVIANEADIGLAFDGDADRCFVVDEKGNPISGSVITLLVGLRELARAKELNSDAQPVIVHNLITSRAVPELLAAHGAQPLRTRVGHSLIKAQMAESGAVFGGEHSGHFYYRDFWFADSGMLTALHVLAALGSNDGMPLSDMADWYQPYFQSGEINSKVKDQTAVRDAIVDIYRKAYPHAEVDYFDGVTFSNWEHHPRWWFNLRGSNTEPYLRLNVEAEDEDIMEKVRDDVLALITRYAD